MKIGIISINMFSKGLNFACPLHTYAFQQFLLQNGIESTVITYTPNYYENFDLRNPYDYYKKKYDRKMTHLPKDDADEEQWAKFNESADYIREKRDLWEPLQKERAIRYEKFQNFIDSRYIRTGTCYDAELLEVEDPGFDCYICATDVIWKDTPGFGFDRGFFLGSTCMENKHKIAYSASRGAHFAESQEDADQFFDYLRDFDVISVREKTLQEYIEENSELKPALVLDPVLLQDREFYEAISVKPPEEHYVLLYYVMEKAKETIRQAALYAKAHHMKIIEITDLPVGEGRLKEFPDVDYTLRYEIGIEEWLGYIENADCIFTNSFHVCCLSVLFEKQFFAGPRGSEKVPLFMEMFHLNHRKLQPKGDPVSSPPSPIDYEEVRPLLEQKREESSAFILNAISQAEKSPREKKDYSAKKKALSFRVCYNSSRAPEKIRSAWDESSGRLRHLSSGTMEYVPGGSKISNNGESRFLKNRFQCPNYQFAGWKLRFRIENRWFWVLEDGSFTPKDDTKKQENLKIFKDRDVIPYLPVNQISVVVADATWKKASFLSKTVRKAGRYVNAVRKRIRKNERAGETDV